MQVFSVLSALRRRSPHNSLLQLQSYNVAHYLLQLPLLRLVSRLFLSPQSGPKKLGHKLTAIILSNVSRFTIFLAGRFLCKFAVNWLLKIPSILAYVATLYLVKTLMSENKGLTMNYEVV